MRRIRSAARSLLLLMLLLTLGAPAALAQEQQPSATPVAGSPLTLFTRYPSLEVAIGEAASFQLTLRTGSDPQIVDLSVQDLPEGWTATFRGEGKIIGSAYVDSQQETRLDLRVEHPAELEAGSYGLTVLGRWSGGETRLPLKVMLKDKLPPSLALDVELPMLKGAPEAVVYYNSTIRNEGDQDLTVNLLSNAPHGLQVIFRHAGQDVSSLPLGPNESKSVTVEVTPSRDTQAGPYELLVTAQSGEAQAQMPLLLEVTGRTDLVLSAPDNRVSGEAYAGEDTPFTMILQNIGSAPARNISLSGSAPSGWTVTFEPDTVPELAPGQVLEVRARVKPSAQSISGDYMVTMNAFPKEGASKSVDFRVTVLTSTIWGLAGIALIAVAVAVVGLAVTRFGRR